MQEFYNELQSGKGPVFLKLNHLHADTVGEIEETQCLSQDEELRSSYLRDLTIRKKSPENAM